LEFLQAAAASGPGVEEPTPIQKFLGGSPSALRHVTSAKPAPVGWGTQEYFSVSAFKLISSSGKETFIRYHVVPEAGVQTLTDSEKSGKSADYLSEELAERIKKGPIGFKLLAQVAAEGDVTDDATVSWPSDREVVELGTVKIEKLVDGEESAEEQKKIIFDPIPRVEGVEASKDPLLEVRAGLYLLSGRERRAGTA
jgi:catalase